MTGLFINRKDHKDHRGERRADPVSRISLPVSRLRGISQPRYTEKGMRHYEEDYYNNFTSADNLFF